MGVVVSSGGAYAGQGPANAFDGAASYYSGYSGSQTYLGRDLGSARVVRLIRVRGTSGFSFYGRLRYSDDGSTFYDTSTIVNAPHSDGAWRDYVIGDYGAHRYWVVSDLQDDSYHQIDEMRLHAMPAAPAGAVTDVTAVGSVFSGGSSYPGQGAVNAFNTPNDWYSGYTSSATSIGRDFETPIVLDHIEAMGTSSFS